MRALTIAELALQQVHIEGVELVVGYNLLFGGPAAAILSEILGVPLVVTVFGEVHSHPAKSAEHRDFFQRVADRGSIIAMSHHCANSLEMIGVEADIEVLPYGIDLRRYAGEHGDAGKRRLGVGPGVPLAVYVGRLVPDMGLDTVLAAIPDLLKRVPEAQVVLAGADGALREAAAAIARDSGGRVLLFVDVPGDEIPYLFAAADVVMVPTPGERACGSLAAIEAMAAGRPVVAAGVGGIPEIVTDECGLLVQPDDPPAVVDAVVTLLTDPERRRVLGRSARHRAEERFELGVTNAAIEHYFLSVIDAKGSKPGSHGTHRHG
jgi:glycosyltransferase involved in cell wall biosynthesis